MKRLPNARRGRVFAARRNGSKLLFAVMWFDAWSVSTPRKEHFFYRCRVALVNELQYLDTGVQLPASAHGRHSLAGHDSTDILR